MTMRIFSPRETNASELLMDGVRDAFSFGPTLIRDGSITDEDIDHTRRIGNETNPRTGLGMVEPGHFVAIVVDGRQKEYSYGMRSQRFASSSSSRAAWRRITSTAAFRPACSSWASSSTTTATHTSAPLWDTYQRRIPDGLVWGYSEQVPSEDDPIYNRGEG